MKRRSRLDEQLPSAGYYGQQFGSLDRAFQKLFESERDRAREEVRGTSFTMEMSIPWTKLNGN